MPEFWETNFNEKQEMWGDKPARSALLTQEFFLEKSLKNILIPGIGYGRNAQVFKNCGMEVTGIEISKTAIQLARKYYGTEMKIHYGSVTDMPFDNNEYDGIFCHALIHLLNEDERAKLILDCYNHLSENGYMFFTAVTKEAKIYRQGKYISKDRFEIFNSVKMFFYDSKSIYAAFERYGLFEVTEVNENYPFYLIKCRKSNP